MAVSASQIQQLYIAYYGRPADPAGLAYWQAQAAAGTARGTTDAAILDSFGASFGSNAEYTATFANMSDVQKVNTVYNNLFSHDADPAGLLYWATKLTNGDLTIANIVRAVSTSATTAANVDGTAFNSKVTAAESFTGALTSTAQILGYTGTAAGVAAKAWITTINSAATLATAIAAPALAATVAVVAAPAVVAGQTFTLTTGTDTGSAFTGGTSNDTFVAVAATTGGTLQVSDVLNGGGGTADIFNLTIDVLATNSVPSAAASNIEIINVRNVSGNAQTIALGNFTGATEINSDRSTGAMTVTGMIAGQALTITGDGATANSTMANTYAATVTTATMNIKSGVTAGAITQTAAGLTTQTINSTGAANTVGAIALSGAATVTALTINAATALTTGNITNFGGTAATITVSGAATSATTNLGVTLGTIENTTVKTIDASGLTAGGISLTMNSNTALVLTGGQGNDRITTGAVLGSTGSANAGAGTGDRLTVAADADITAAAGLRYSNFEVVQLTAARTIDMDHLATNNTITGLRLDGTATVTNINAATAANIQIIGSSTPSLGIKNATNVGQIDTVNITVSDETAGLTVFTLTTPVLTGVEKLNLIATDSITVTAMTSAASLDALTITGAGAISITTGAVATVLNSSVNASAGTGTFLYTAAATTGGNGQAITGSATKANTITGTANADIITGGSVADTITNQTVAVTASAGDVITGGAGFDTFVLHGSIASAALTAAANTTARIADFTVGTTTTTTDFLQLNPTQAQYGAAVAFNGTVATAAAGATVIQSVQQSNGAAAITAGADMIKLTTAVAVVNGTTTLAQAFASAIGTSSVTGLTATSAIFFSLYDTTNSRMVVGIVDSTVTGGANTSVETGDTVVLVGTLNMTAADYANFSNASLIIT